MDRVHLHIAFTWICPNCRRRNYIKAIEAEVLDENFEKKDPYGLGTWDADKFDDKDSYLDVMSPEEVTCKKCGTTYEPVAP